MESTKFTGKHGSTEMLNDRNYHSWKRSLKAFLIAEDAFGIVTGTEARRTRARLLCVWHSIPQPRCPGELRPFAVFTRLQ